MQATMADIFETYIRWVVVCIALLAAKALAGSVALLADSWATALSRAELLMSLLAWITFAVIGITAALRQTRLLYRLNGASDLKRRGRVDDDSFTFQACRSAGFLSLVVTGGTLGILQHVSTQVALPGAFFIKLALFICCASFVTCYCIITRATDDAATGS